MRQARSARQKKRPVDYELAAWTAPHPIGRFRIKRRLGEGGMGVVYVGVDDTLQREVAIKLLRSESARPAARIQHPAVCTIFEVGESEGAPFIVMELLDASTREGYEAAERALQRALELSPERPVSASSWA